MLGLDNPTCYGLSIPSYRFGYSNGQALEIIFLESSFLQTKMGLHSLPFLYSLLPWLTQRKGQPFQKHEIWSYVLRVEEQDAKRYHCDFMVQLHGNMNVGLVA